MPMKKKIDFAENSRYSSCAGFRKNELKLEEMQK